MTDTFFQDTPPPSPAAPAAPTVDMDLATEGSPAFEVPDQAEFDTPTFGRRPPAGEGPQHEAAPSAKPAPPIPDRSAEFEAKIEGLEKRLHDTQAYANLAAQQRNSAGEMLEAIDRREQSRMQHMQQAAALQPPQVEDRDALLTDPDAIQESDRQWAEWGFRRAQSEYAPYLQMADQLAQVQPQLLQLGEQYAWWQAQGWTEHDGIPADEFQEFAPQARQIIGSYTNDPAQVQAAMMNPETVRWAVHMARSQSGRPAPVKGGAAAPPSPTGSGGTAARPGRAGSSRKPEFIRMAEQRFGVKIPEDAVDGYRERFG